MEEHKNKGRLAGEGPSESQVLLRSLRKTAREGYTLSSKGRTRELRAGKTLFFFKPGAKTYVSLSPKEPRQWRTCICRYRGCSD